MSKTDPVAIVVVHGIADQRAGQSVREIARLLCHGSAARYARAQIQNLLVPVEKLEPGPGAGHPVASAEHANGTAGEASRQTPGAPSGFYQAQHSASPEPALPPSEPTRDLGLALNEYLLGRLQLSEAEQLYESTRVALRRQDDGRPVDLYELHWADLSRLGSGGLRVVSALYQLFFHLGTLAADVVDQVALTRGGGASWRLLQRLHAWLAWLMRAPLALVQLCMLLMVFFGAAALVAPELQAQLLAAIFGVGAIVSLGLGVMAWLHATTRLARWAKVAAMLVAAAVCVAVAVASLAAPTWVPVLYVVASALVIALAGVYLVERYAGVTQGVRVLGLVLVLGSVTALGLIARALLPHVSTQFEWMVTASLNIGEWLLAAVLLIWAIFTLIQIMALLLGLWMGRECSATLRTSLHTARLALVGSSGSFAVLSLVLWSVVSFFIGRGLTQLNYEPVIFGTGYRSAAIFLEERVQSLGAFFTPLVFAFALLGATALLALLPSLLEEISPTANVDARGTRPGAQAWARRLGNWLSGAMRMLGNALVVLVPAGAIAGSILYLVFALEQVAISTNMASDVTQWLSGPLHYLQGETLVAVGKWLAGGAVTIALLGNRFTQTFGRLRVAIDALLDIDNYFGDPPDRQPPRARIFSRYASLLAYLREHGYSRVVIVSHSQGSVISADLLRYLHVQGRLSEFAGAMPIALVTVGSPLRDLYAGRFPLLYRWMGSNAGSFEQAAPQASDIGVVEWVNACRSGDYVGRFIWTPAGDSRRFDIAGIDSAGRVDARRAGNRTEFCLGAGAHTHYFSNDAQALAAEIDRLVTGERVADAQPRPS